MDARELIGELTADGIVLAVVDDRLAATGPQERLDPQRQKMIRQHRDEMIQMLSLPRIWNQALDSLTEDPLFPDDLIQRLRQADLELASSYDTWTDAEIFEVWQERVAIMVADGCLSSGAAEKQAFDWIVSEVGQKRIHRIARDARFRPDATTDTPKDSKPLQRSDVAIHQQNFENKVADGCVNTRQPDHPTV